MNQYVITYSDVFKLLQVKMCN